MKLKNLFKNLVLLLNPFFLIKYFKLKRLNKATHQAHTSFEVDKIIFKRKLIDDIKHIIKLKGSKYIPEDIKNNAEIIAIAESRHQEKIKFYNIKIDLKTLKIK